MSKKTKLGQGLLKGLKEAVTSEKKKKKVAKAKEPCYDNKKTNGGFMSRNAEDLADLIVEKKEKAKIRAYDILKGKVTALTTQMLTDLSYSDEVDLDDEDLLALGQVTEHLRELGFKFRFIEIQNNSGETLKHKLLVSIEHLI